jgi:hypothetical protein
LMMCLIIIGKTSGLGLDLEQFRVGNRRCQSESAGE